MQTTILRLPKCFDRDSHRKPYLFCPSRFRNIFAIVVKTVLDPPGIQGVIGLGIGRKTALCEFRLTKRGRKGKNTFVSGILRTST